MTPAFIVAGFCLFTEMFFAASELAIISCDRVGLRKLFPGCHLDEPFEKPRETDEAYLERLRKFVRSAPEIEMNDHRAIIVGVCEATRTFQSNPVVYTLYSRTIFEGGFRGPALYGVLSDLYRYTKPGDHGRCLSGEHRFKAIA